MSYEAEAAVVEAEVEAPPKKRFTFEVMSGTHWETMDVKRTTDSGQDVVEKRDVPFGPGRPAGAIVHTDSDLRKMNKKGHPIKCRFIDPDAHGSEQELAVERLRADKSIRLVRQTLGMLTADQLRKYAEVEGIAIGNIVQKDDILKVIFAALP